MGVYLNPGNDMFHTAIHSEIYVDKTDLIKITNRALGTMQKFICVSRPRRFGKSMAAYMLAAYYGRGCDSSEQFAPYRIAMCDSYEKYLNKYNVIMLNVQDFLSMTESVGEMLLFLQKRVIAELKRQYPGILPVKKYGTHSALNMFMEYSMTAPRISAEYIGFTEEVRLLCEQYHVDFDAMKSWYDGYTFPKVPHIYNPKSVVDALMFGEFGSYWTRTETYEALKIYIDLNYDGLKDDIIEMLAGQRVSIHTNRFQNDMITFESKDDVLTLLVHLGYLAYDSDSWEVFIPNTEIRGEFRNAVTGEYWKEVATALETSDRLLRATWDGDAETVAELLDAAHMENTSFLTYNDENSLSCVISIAYYSAMKDYTKIRELPSGEGFADIVYLSKKYSDKPAMIVELICDGSADGALAQIREKNYVDSLQDYKGSLILVGINYDKKTKTHDCIIEKWCKNV